MTDPAAPDRPVPRWLHAGAALAVGVALFPLVLGQVVTTVRAGMADPLWPTEPWYLFSNFRFDLGYLVEHSHRIAGFVTGGVIVLVALGAWWTEPRGGPRWAAVGGVLVLVGAYGEFHRAAMSGQAGGAFELPAVPAAVMGLAVVLLAAVGGSGLAAAVPGSGLRLFATAALLAVMGQGLLGGLRVRLNALSGPELAAVHGLFGQVVFGLLVALAVLTARRPAAGRPGVAARWASAVLVGVVLVQLVWGVQVRHLPTTLAQRLHLLTAFGVLAGVAWVLWAVLADPAARRRVGPAAWALAALVGVQVVLGVEAWMGKFSDEARAGLPAESFLAEAQTPSPLQAALRTTHVLVGTLLLAVAVGLAVRTGQPGSGGVRGDAT